MQTIHVRQRRCLCFYLLSYVAAPDHDDFVYLTACSFVCEQDNLCYHLISHDL